MQFNGNCLAHGATLFFYTLEFAVLIFTLTSESPRSKVALDGELVQFNCTITLGIIYWFINRREIQNLPPAVRSNINVTYSSYNTTGEKSTLTILANTNTNNSQLICAHSYGSFPPALLLVQEELTSPSNLTVVFNETKKSVDLNWAPPFTLSIDGDANNFCENFEESPLILHFVILAKFNSSGQTGNNDCNNSIRGNVDSPQCLHKVKTNETKYQFHLEERNISMCDLKYFDFMVRVVSRTLVPSNLSDPVGVPDDMVNSTGSCTSSDNNLTTAEESDKTTQASFTETEFNVTPLALGIIGGFILIFSGVVSIIICCYIKKTTTTEKFKMTHNAGCYGTSGIAGKSEKNRNDGQSRASPLYEDPDALIGKTDSKTLPVYSEITNYDQSPWSVKKGRNGQWQSESEHTSFRPVRESSSSPRHSLFRDATMGHHQQDQLVNSSEMAVPENNVSNTQRVVAVGKIQQHTYEPGKISRIECDGCSNTPNHPFGLQKVVSGVEEYDENEGYVIEPDYKTHDPVKETHACRLDGCA